MVGGPKGPAHIVLKLDKQMHDSTATNAWRDTGLETKPLEYRPNKLTVKITW